MTQPLLTLRNLTWAYVLLFVLLVGMNYMPFIMAENGKVFGFFHLGHAGNVLHVISGIWALLAAITTRGAQLFYFRVFGSAYFLDGVVGVVFGSAYLNGNIFDSTHAPVAAMSTRFVVNAPHLIIGGLAMLIGFVLYKRVK